MWVYESNGSIRVSQSVLISGPKRVPSEVKAREREREIGMRRVDGLIDAMVRLREHEMHAQQPVSASSLYMPWWLSHPKERKGRREDYT